jgi:poly-gamma-glutamate synthesis protein (capsule biosynthesis protein)
VGKHINRINSSKLIIILILLAFLISCNSTQDSRSTATNFESIATHSASPDPAIKPTHEISLPPYSIWIDPSLPRSILKRVSPRYDFIITSEKEAAQIELSPQGEIQIGNWLYLAVVPFFSPIENIQIDELVDLWQNGSSNSKKIFLDPETKHYFSSIWDTSEDHTIVIANQNQLLPTLWQHPSSIAIIPFEDLEPKMKVLSVDGIDPLSPDFSIFSYPLSIPLKLNFREDLDPTVTYLDPITNMDLSKLTSIALTGVTAIVRDTAVIMEEQGILYPALDIGPLLSSVDITHISNEVPFAEDCPPPDSNQESLYFCSQVDYIQLLEEVGTDIVELSGDHFGDWGPEAMLHSLDMYHQRGWLTYGGGANLQAGLDPVFIEHNGNRFAFIGCNGKVHDKYATASETNPGASRCDFDWMMIEINKLSELGYLVIATMQHEEVDSFHSIAIQQYDFRRLADSGAVIVSGSQAHHPQAVEFYKSSFIHYGLGNLFFDQFYLARYNPSEHINKDKSFIDIHYFYDGSYINSRLVPLLFIDNARPRMMTYQEKTEFLDMVYGSSIWDVQTK